MKPSPSKKFRSGSSFSRRAGPSGNSCVTYQPSVSGEHKAQVTTKAEVEPGQRQVGVPVWWVLPPSLLSPYHFLLRNSVPHSCSRKAKLLHIFSYIPPTPFSLLFDLLIFFLFLFSRRPLGSSWCFTSDSTFGENQWGLDYSWPLFLTCSGRDFASANYKVGSLVSFSM